MALLVSGWDPALRAGVPQSRLRKVGVPYLAVHRSRISSNDAQGGGSGGDGLGGGIFNGGDGLLDLPASAVSRNRAQGGPGGDGVGGGLYNMGTVDDALALIFANFASTSDDDCFGC